jgi:hypothetical protein
MDNNNEGGEMMTSNQIRRYRHNNNNSNNGRRSNNSKQGRTTGSNNSITSSARNKVNNDHDHDVHETRRMFLNAAALNLCLLGGGVGAAMVVTPNDAANAASSDEQPTATKYISGKPPQVGGKPVEKSGDVKGTRKDPDFLRSIADCRSQCQSTAGPDGLSKSKEDCLSECQDICCKTYEQCTFNIVPRI